MSDTLSALGRAAYGGSVLDQIAHPAIVNPLQAYSSAVQTARGVYDLRQQQAQQALGQTYQDAIDPQTGRFDPQQFNALLSQRPAAAMAAQSGVESSQKLSGEQYNLANAQNGALNTALAGVLKLPDDQLANGVVQQTQRLISAGVIPPDRAHAALLGLNGTDPATLRTQLETMWRGTLPPAQQQEATYGHPFTQTGPNGVTIGGTLQTSGANAGAASSPPQSGAPLGMTPDQLNETVWLPDPRKTLPDGSPNPGYMQKIPMTRGQILQTLQPNTPVGGVPGAGTGVAPPQGQSPLGSGRYPSPGVRNPNAALPVPPMPPAQTSSTTPPLVQPSEADVETAKMAPGQFQSEVNTGQAQQQQLATLSTMQSDLGRFTSGTGAERTLDWKRAVQSWAPGIAQSFGIKADNIGAQESFDKAVNMIVAQQNPGSDNRMNVQMGATPHSTLSPEGADFIIRQLQGNSDYLQARAKLAQAYPNRSDYQGFQKSVADLDPRYFQYQRLNPQQKQAWLNGLP